MKKTALHILLIIGSFLISTSRGFSQEVSFNNGPSQRIHLITDRGYYFSGQAMNIDILNIAAMTYDLSHENELVYIVLKGLENHDVFIEKILTKKGTASFVKELPVDLPTGYYELIAYTNWMRNFDRSYFFRKKMAIYNPSESPARSINRPIPKVEFYPEGQTMPSGITNKVVVKCSFESPEKIFVQNESGEEIYKVKIDSLGWGSFYIRPKANEEYYLKAVIDNNLHSFQLPSSSVDTYSLSVRQTSENVRVIIQAADRNFTSEHLRLILSMNGVFLSEINLEVTESAVIKDISLENMPHGILDIALINLDSSMLNSRSVYVKSDNLEGAHSVTVTPNKSLITNKKALLSYHSTANNPTHLHVKISSKTNYINEEFRMLESLHPSLQLRTVRNYEDKNEIDNRLIAYKPTAQLFTRVNKQQFPPENHYYLKGVLMDNKPLPKSTRMSFFIPKHNMIYETKIDPTGQFAVPLLIPFIGSQQIFYHATCENHHFVEPRVHASEANNIASLLDLEGRPIADASIQLEMKEQMKLANINKVYSYFLDGSAPNQDLNAHTSISQLLIPDHEVDMTKYHIFSTMTEFIKEALPSVRHRSNDGVDKINVYSGAHFYESTPFVFVNNSPVGSLDAFLSISPEDVLKIMVVGDPSKLALIGDFGANGVIMVETKSKSYSTDTSKSDHLNSFTSTGLTSNDLSPLWHKRYHKNRAPDFRDSLLSQTFRIGSDPTKNVSFRTSGTPQDYIVTSLFFGNGKLSHSLTAITVRNQENSEQIPPK